MERNDQYYSNNYYQHYGNDRNNTDDISRRYGQRGNYYGSNQEHGNVRIQQRHDFNDFSEGPTGGYGAGNYNENYNRVHRNRDNHYRYGDDSHFQQSHGYSSQGDYRNQNYRNRDYRSRQDSDNYSRSQPYSSNYDVAGNRQYARQENSYQNPGHGRRYTEYGRDERNNYGHELTDIHHDRGELRDSSYNDYDRNYNLGNNWDFNENREDYRYKGQIVDSGRSRNNPRNEVDRGPRPSGPDYSKWSPLGNYGYETFGI